MGKRGGFKGRAGYRQNDRGGQARKDDRGQEVKRENERFERYYDSLGVYSEDEKDDFWQALRRDLPNSFRFTGSKAQALPVQQLLKDRYIPEITAIQHDGNPVAPPEPIAWFPDQLAWQMTTPKNIIRRFPPFASFQKFLVSETSVGNISRQEIVSMIPPLMMDMRPGMVALDMCAAPGSKAAQLIEMVHAGEEARMLRAKAKRQNNIHKSEITTDDDEDDDDGDDGRATGLLIANDNDYRRAHMLTHQMKRLNSPNLIVTNHDATMFPSIKLNKGTSTQNKYLKFDRILADVPCSGDGTCRKNIGVWKDWTPANALGLFPTQLRILTRAIQMLKPGGRVVYSTCSMNPVENEAVVKSAIQGCGGLSKVDLVDCAASLPKLKRKHGLKEWKVMDKAGSIWPSWAEVQKKMEEVGEDRVGRVLQDMFPSPDLDIALDRCMRIYPHLQDTGGFFIAVLEKKGEARSKSAVATTAGPSVLNVVDEIANRPTKSGADVTQRIESLDAIAPVTLDGDIEGTSAAARQNKEVIPSEESSAMKRKVHGEADALMSTKRPKFREEVNDAAPEGAEDRQVHFPPPPGAQLEATRPSERPDTSAVGLGGQQSSANRAAKPAHDKIDTTNPNTVAATTTTTPNHQSRRNQPVEEPFVYLAADQPDLVQIREFFDISSTFPRDRFMVRNATGQPAKTIYYSSALAREILTSNANSGLKFVHCGVKMFVKQDVQSPEVCRWRVQSEGLPILEPFVSDKRVVRLHRKSTLRGLLIEMFPKVSMGVSQELGEISERVKAISMGCCILRVDSSDCKNQDQNQDQDRNQTQEDKNTIKIKTEKKDDEDDDDDNAMEGFKQRMVMPLWRSLHSLNLMLPKEERKAMLLRLYNEETPLMDHSKERFNKHVPEPVAEYHDNGNSSSSNAGDLEEKFTTDVKDEDSADPNHTTVLSSTHEMNGTA